MISYPDVNDFPPGLKVFLEESGDNEHVIMPDEKLNSRLGGWPGWVQSGRLWRAAWQIRLSNRLARCGELGLRRLHDSLFLPERQDRRASHGVRRCARCPMPSLSVGGVGAGSVVIRDFSDGVFAAGNPCRIIERSRHKGLLHCISWVLHLQLRTCPGALTHLLLHCCRCFPTPTQVQILSQRTTFFGFSGFLVGNFSVQKRLNSPDF